MSLVCTKTKEDSGDYSLLLQRYYGILYSCARNDESNYPGRLYISLDLSSLIDRTRPHTRWLNT